MKIAKTIALFILMLSPLATYGGDSPVDLTYSFVLTNRHGQDILLIAPDNKDARIGVLGKWFIPSPATAKAPANWPVGVWTATGSPPDLPSWIKWEYKLELSANGTARFQEEEYSMKYSEDLSRVLENWRLTRTLQLSGIWRLLESGRGEIHFNIQNEKTPNPSPAPPPQSTTSPVRFGVVGG